MSSLRATVESMGGDKAVLRFDDGQQLIVPISACEGTVTQGASARLMVLIPESVDAGRQPLARELLNEILGS